MTDSIPSFRKTPGVPQGVYGDLKATVEPTRWGWTGSVTDGMIEGPYLWAFTERRLLRRIERHVRQRIADGERGRTRRTLDLNAILQETLDD